MAIVEKNITEIPVAPPQAEAIRLPPQNIEAEMSVLGSLMLDKDAIFRVADILSPRDFYKSLHADIYETMLDLVSTRDPIDIISVTNRLKEKGKLDQIGGASYLATLINTVPTASHIEHYGSVVKRKRLLRDLIQASHHIAQLGYREAEEVEELIDEAEQKIFGIAKDSLRQDFSLVREALGEAWGRIERLHSGGGNLRGVSTGFLDLDSYLAGLQKSDLIVLAARPSLGKTSLALNIGRNVAVQEKKAVGIFSVEMSREQVVDRLLAAEAQVDLWRLRTGRLRSDGPDNDFIRIRDAMDRLSSPLIYIDDTPSPTVMEIRAKSRRLQAREDLGLVVVDYLQLVRGRDNSESRVQEVSDISRALKALAKELNVPVLALSQLSRAVEMRPAARPKLSDLRESGSIEQDADVVLFIYREDKVKENSEKKNIAEILIEKHRNGPTGKVDLYFHDETASFRSIAKHYEEPL
jgi:replicative DNA helicase